MASLEISHLLGGTIMSYFTHDEYESNNQNKNNATFEMSKMKYFFLILIYVQCRDTFIHLHHMRI